MLYNLADLRIPIVLDGKRVNTLLESSPYSKSLRLYSTHYDQAKHIYEDYNKNIVWPNRTSKRIYEEFISLYENIRDNGYNYEAYPKIYLNGILIRDGHHRLSILYCLDYKDLDWERAVNPECFSGGGLS